MPGIAHPVTNSAAQQVQFIPHGAVIFYGLVLFMLIFVWLWVAFIKHLPKDKYCWMCGGDKDENLCFMGAHHFRKDDDGNWHDLAT
jgi:hypothetical protein